MSRTTRTITRTVTAAAMVALAAALLLATSGCTYFASPGAATEKPAPKVATAGASVAGDLGSAYPASLPIWEGAKVVTSEELGNNVYELTLTTPDAFDEVVYGVGKGLEAAGFTVETLDDSAGTSMLMATSDTLSALYTITGGTSGADTTIAISADLGGAVVNK